MSTAPDAPAACRACGAPLTRGPGPCPRCGSRAHDAPRRRRVAGAAPVAPGSVAPVGRRVVAHALDVVVLLAAAALGRAVSATAPDLPAALLPGVLAGVAALAQWVTEARTGASVGGAVTGIRTVSAATGRPAGLVAVLVRRLVVVAGALVLLVGEWVVVASGAWDASPAQRGWHDKAAGTLVLRAAALRAPTPPVRRSGPTTPPTSAPVITAPPAVLPGGAPSRPASGPVITGLPGAQASAPVPAAVRTTEIIDAPAVPTAPARDLPARPQAPALLVGPRPDRVGSPQVRPADPGLGALDRLPDAPVVRAADPGWDEPEPGTTPERDEPQPGADRGGDGPLPDADLERTRLRPEAPAPRGVHLRFDTGEAVDVTSDGLVGRNPTAEEGTGHVIAIDDPDRSISRVHLAFGPEPGGRLWVLDRGSTNGTVLVRPDGSSAVLPPATRAVVEPGWTVRFGRRSLRVHAR